MSKKLHISLIFRNLVVSKTLSLNQRMYNLYTKFVKILEICKKNSKILLIAWEISHAVAQFLNFLIKKWSLCH